MASAEDGNSEAAPGYDTREAYAACPDLQQADIDHLLALGVPAEAIASPTAVVKARVAYMGRSCFEFDVAGQMALILPAIEDGDLVDLVAWHPRSGHVAAWLGTAKALGWSDLYSPSLTGDPLKVWANPLGWLRTGRRGLVPTDIERMARSLFLWGDHVSEFICENPEHGRAIRAAFNRRPPRILTPIIEAAAA